MIKLINCTFERNAAGQYGGAVYTSQSDSRIINTQFKGNSASGGGALCLTQSSQADLGNCTLASNLTSYNQGNAILFYVNEATFDHDSSRVHLTNCIAWNNGGAHTLNSTDITFFPNRITTDYNLFEASVINYSGTNNLTTSISPFVSSANMELSACSPAIDAGYPYSTTATSGRTDLAGNTRFYNGGRIDLGAYEYQGLPTPLVTITAQTTPISSAVVGTMVTASVSTTGNVSQYQWYKDGSAVTGQTSATLTLNNVQLGDAGRYWVVVIGTCNSLSSTAFSLSVRVGPIRYVRQTRSGQGDGSSWANASSDLQAMINAEDVEQVWVAGGIYKPTTGSDRTISFAMKNDVAIYGGFPPTGTPTMADRYFASYPTVLSGEIGASGTQDNSYHVFFNNNGLTNSAILDGFVITAGNATSSNPNDNGGGMLNITSSPLLRNCIFIGNTATNGGALYNYNTNGSPLLINCVVQANSAAQGGALFNNGSSPQLTNCSLVGNTGVGGGAYLTATVSPNSSTACCGVTAVAA